MGEILSFPRRPSTLDFAIVKCKKLGPFHITIVPPMKHGAGWLRVNKLLVQVKKTKPLFSERNGYTKFIKLPFCSWRVRVKLED